MGTFLNKFLTVLNRLGQCQGKRSVDFYLRATICPRLDAGNSRLGSVASFGEDEVETNTTTRNFWDFWDLVIDVMDFSHFSNPAFLFFALSNFLLYMWYDVPYVYIADHGLNLSFTESQASMLISVIGILNMFGEGPVKLELVDIRISLGVVPEVNASVGLNRSTQVVFVNLNLRASLAIDEVKFSMHRIQNGKPKVQILHQVVRSPCKGIYYELYKQLFTGFVQDFPNKNGVCIVKKGDYKFVVNPEAALNALLGQKFYYGEFLFKIAYFSKRRLLYSIFCSMILTQHKI